MEKDSISIYFVHAALAPVVRRGMDTEQLLCNAGIAPSLLQSHQSRVTAQNFSLLWLGVARALDDELFGQDTRRMKVGSLALLCEMLVDCATLHHALLRMTEFFNLILDDFHCALEAGSRHAQLTIRETPGAGAPRVFGYETLLMLQHGVACWLVGRRIPLIAAAFAYPEPPCSAEYKLMYSERLSFGAGLTSVSFERACLDLPVIQDQRTVKDFVRAAPANIVLKYRNTSGLSAQIRQRLRTAARTEWPDFDDVAHAMHITPSTLRRRLQDEGQSYQIIKDQLRRDMAINALCHSAKSVADISTELGFAEASAFHRAFKKWTGACPGEYRQQMQKPRPGR